MYNQLNHMGMSAALLSASVSITVPAVSAVSVGTLGTAITLIIGEFVSETKVAAVDALVTMFAAPRADGPERLHAPLCLLSFVQPIVRVHSMT